MRALILIIFAILCAGTCRAQVELTPANGKMKLILDLDAKTISVSNPGVKSFTFQWPDGTDMSYDLLNQNKFKFNRFVKRFKIHPYTWVRIGRGFYTNAKNKDDKIYKYNRHGIH